ncbi:TIGR03915 family putative DNA repair protein [Sporomusa sp.]|uniref:TIGR03915 family putative DNA repair protein n=1 Tax=Sporomusa sp. TaxID=2078658 RepID=UPI002CD52750|nr:TIGR03915 family putative DNA repair protein [Sporomusa sp.]HWR08807.1 TIGR03915 family putative DNA repair protein [Sporomusa sp.]
MHNQSDLIYSYDGSFDGLLCCVFESYEKKEIPLDILLADASQPLLFSAKKIHTDLSKASRVLASIPKKMGTSALNLVRHAFLTCLVQKELYILLFLRLGYSYGPTVMNMLTDDVVNTLFKAVNHLNRESHLLKGFLRFSIFNNVLVGEIEPKNYVLPLLVQHFCERYPEERFLIHDKAHGMGLVYQPYQSAVIPIGALELPEVDEEEQTFRELWQLFYDTIAIQGRHNPQCRMSHMPKRYWAYMTEFDRTQKNTTPKLPGSSVKLLSMGLAKSN